MRSSRRAGALFLGVVSNLEGVLEFMRLNGMGSQGFYDWIRIDGLPGPNRDAAAELDAAGFLVVVPREPRHQYLRRHSLYRQHDTGVPVLQLPAGDMHPHVMSIPFALLFVGIALNMYRLPRRLLAEYRSVYPYAIVLSAAVILGGLGFNNLWDMPTFAALRSAFSR